MDTETKTETDVVTGNNEGEGNEEENISVPKKDYDTLNQTLGSLKRELKDLKKLKEEPKETKETPKENQKPDDALLQRIEKMALRLADITHSEDIELAQKTAKKWNVDIDEVITDEDFQVKLKKQQDARSNVEATSGVKGSGSSTSKAKESLEYWTKEGRPPTPAEVPNTEARRKIVRGMLNASKGDGKMKFYNS